MSAEVFLTCKDLFASKMRYTATVIGLAWFTAQLLAQSPSAFIHVDQFGYVTNAEKVAVLSDPQFGFNNAGSFTPNGNVEVVDASSNTVVYSGAAIPWQAGAVHPESGDRGWWFDFSAFTTAGIYRIRNNGELSPTFRIGDNVYKDVLRDAGRMFFYNRCNHPKGTPYAALEWTDGLDFMNPLQDANCRFIDDPTNAGLEKDLTGGWYDAGDYNKYVSFAGRAVHDLLSAYEENPQAFSDDWDIPESGNGIPDLLDEVKWELDWLVKMNNSDGSTHNKMGSQNHSENSSSPPSVNTDQRFYGPTCTSASIRVALVFAQAAHAFQGFPSMASFAQDMETRAIASYDYWIANFLSNTLETDCDDGSIVSGDADVDIENQLDDAVGAAAYLFRLTSNNSYSAFLQSVHLSAEQISIPYWGAYKMAGNDGLLMYQGLPNANGNLSSSITAAATDAASNNWNGYFGFNETEDLYRGFMPDWSYHWGSNRPKANYGVLNMSLARNGINTAASSDYERGAAELLHNFHGVNPLGLVYLTNMGHLGAERSCNEMYHTWFADGTDWDNAQTSAFGPPPGYLTGGPNRATSVATLTPPFGQPEQKSYLDFNTNWPDNSWEVSEPGIYYQAAYIRLLANFVDSSAIATSVSGAVAPSSINQYPNPAADQLNVVGLEQGQHLAVTDMLGRTIMRKAVLRAKEVLNLADFAGGAYLLTVLNADGDRVHSAQFLVR